MTIRTSLTELLGIEHPVLLAPMAGISGGALAAAVSNAGGLGLIAKRAAIAATGDTTVRSSVYDVARNLDWPPAWNLRTLQNDFTRQWHADAEGLARNIERERHRFEAARRDGDTAVSAVIVGEAVDLVQRQEPAGAILRRLVAAAEARLRQASAQLEGGIQEPSHEYARTEGQFASGQC